MHHTLDVGLVVGPAELGELLFFLHPTTIPMAKIIIAIFFICFAFYTFNFKIS
jgi:hypothetical protein